MRPRQARASTRRRSRASAASGAKSGDKAPDKLARLAPASQEQEAESAEVRRFFYRKVFSRALPEDPGAKARDLAELLGLLCRSAGDRGLYPDVQQELYQRARRLFEGVVEATLPRRRANARLPHPDEVDSLFEETRQLLGPNFDLAWWLRAMVQFGTGEATPEDRRHQRGMPMGDLSRYPEREVRRERRESLDLWVERSVPLSATNRDISEAKKRCWAVLERSTRRARNLSEHALGLVAALLGSTPGMIKKVRARRSRRQPSR